MMVGAGASRPMGYPLSSELLPRIVEDLRDNSAKPAWSKWAAMGKTAEERRQKRDDLVHLLNVLLPGLAQAKGVNGGTSIVDVLSVVDHLIEDRMSPCGGLSDGALRRSRGLLTIAINGVLQGRRQPELAKALVRWILKSRERVGSRFTLISTNYDTAIEQVLYRTLMASNASVARAVDFGMPWRDINRDQIHPRPADAQLAVLKLHGSLNWLRCEICGHAYINVHKRILPLEFMETPSPAGYNACHCTGRLRAVMVAPSLVRDIRDSNLLGIWTAAQEEFRRADEWIFIGFSFPSEDIAIRSMLLRAWHSRARKRLKVRVVQRDPAGGGGPSVTEQRYRMLIPNGPGTSFTYSGDGLEAFVKSLS